MIKIAPRTLFLLFACIGLLSSCMQIREKVFLKQDGSGTFSLSLDLSQMIKLLESMGAESEEVAEDGLGKLEESFAGYQADLVSLNGIDNVRIQRMDDENTVTILFDFENIEALNDGANMLIGPDEDGADNIEIYRYSGKRFERTAYFDHAQQIKSDLENSDELNGADPYLIFTEMSYTTEFEFEAPVRKMSNEAATLSADNRTVTFEYFFFREQSEGTSVENVVKL